MQTQRFKTEEMAANDRSLLLWEIAGFIFVSGMAVLFHFLYEFSGNQTWVGIFTATNESVFEHTKILFYPYLIFSIIEYFFIGRELHGFFSVKALSAILLPIAVITFFYTYTGVWGQQSMIVDIASTFVYAFLTFALSYTLLKKGTAVIKPLRWTIPVLFIVIILMIWWSLAPPKIQLFYDTMNHTFGMLKS